jgi:isochorismate synthase
VAPSDSKLSALSRIREALVCARHETSEEQRWLVVSIEIPAHSASRLVDLGQASEAVYFSGGQADHTYVGLGAAERRTFSGNERFREAASFVQDTFAHTHIPEDLVPHVRFFGGAAFSPGKDGTSETWRDFGEASFTLPQCICVFTHHSIIEPQPEPSVFETALSNQGKAAVDAGLQESAGFQESALFICIAERSDFEPTLNLAAHALKALFQPAVANSEAPQAGSQLEGEGRTEFHARVKRIKQAIDAGTVQKVVAARRVTLALPQAPRASALMERLATQAPLCARFALRLGRATFVGATPERLVEKRGMQIATEALAGSVSTEEVNGERLLLESPKDLEEHALVVQALKEDLSPVCSHLTLPEKPMVRRLRTILHLRTPVSGKLAEPMHVLSLVDRLHPTPAVGGLPRERAIEFIAREEPVERGWYAAPIGWIDSRGDGEFVVALRSGLFTGGEVHLYSGAGIVKDSDPAQEYEETELKLLSMLGALGVASSGPMTAAGGELTSDGEQITAKGPGRRDPGGLGAHEKSPERPHELPRI